VWAPRPETGPPPASGARARQHRADRATQEGHNSDARRRRGRQGHPPTHRGRPGHTAGETRKLNNRLRRTGSPRGKGRSHKSAQLRPRSRCPPSGRRPVKKKRSSYLLTPDWRNPHADESQFPRPGARVQPAESSATPAPQNAPACQEIARSVECHSAQMDRRSHRLPLWSRRPWCQRTACRCRWHRRHLCRQRRPRGRTGLDHDVLKGPGVGHNPGCRRVCVRRVRPRACGERVPNDGRLSSARRCEPGGKP
jgi:hypothetical protein